MAGLPQWSIPTSLPDVQAVVRVLRDLMAKLGRTPTWGDHRTVTTATTVVDSDDLILVDTTSGSVTVTLPSAVGRRGRKFACKKLIAANTMTLAGAGSETIDGAATVGITTQYAARTVQSDGINWHIVAAHL